MSVRLKLMMCVIHFESDSKEVFESHVQKAEASIYFLNEKFERFVICMGTR